MKPLTKVAHWTPRILCILAILLISVFALDAFSPGLSLWKQLLAFIIHLIPSFILILLLIVAWKWEKIGGIIMTVAGIAFCVFLFIINFRRLHNSWNSFTIMMALGFPFALSGFLFIISNYLKKKEMSGE